ncbi:TPA: hypothetical protein R9084_001878, partial [Campylobacter coli]|nr:hypothetical protein [Campylobacter coli]
YLKICKKIDNFNQKIYKQTKEDKNKKLYTLELGFCLYSDKKISKEEYEKVFFSIKEKYDNMNSNMEYDDSNDIISIRNFIENYKKYITQKS